MIMSRHKPGVIYLGGNCVFKLTDRMEKYSVISPDLTHNDPTKTNATGSGAGKLRGRLFACRVAETRWVCCGRGRMMAGSGLQRMTVASGLN